MQARKKKDEISKYKQMKTRYFKKKHEDGNTEKDKKKI